MKTFIDDDDIEARLFNEILELTPEGRERLIEAIRTYDLVMTNADKVLPIPKS